MNIATSLPLFKFGVPMIIIAIAVTNFFNLGVTMFIVAAVSDL